jgi:H2-forming N5,N10-methylenetetrahydromethanopterin dehydrogenase-like enzyme
MNRSAIVGYTAVVSGAETTSPVDRLVAISSRLVTLRAQATALSSRVEDATARSREVRTEPRAGCNHSAQVQQMQSALNAVELEIEGLRTAMLTRGVIEQAKGMLMLRRQCEADEAFRVLVELSQTSHRKLAEVAEMLVREWAAGGHGTA